MSKSSSSSVVAVIIGFFVLGAGSLALGAAEDQIRARIMPAGEVCLIGDPCAAAAGISGDSNAPAAAMSPDTIYSTYCFACHGTGANNSPVLGDRSAWAPRIAKGLDVLYQSAIEGFNGGIMPVKGLCMACSDADVQATVDYMLESVQ